MKIFEKVMREEGCLPYGLQAAWHAKHGEDPVKNLFKWKSERGFQIGACILCLLVAVMGCFIAWSSEGRPSTWLWRFMFPFFLIPAVAFWRLEPREARFFKELENLCNVLGKNRANWYTTEQHTPKFFYDLAKEGLVGYATIVLCAKTKFYLGSPQEEEANDKIAIAYDLFALYGLLPEFKEPKDAYQFAYAEAERVIKSEWAQKQAAAEVQPAGETS